MITRIKSTYFIMKLLALDVKADKLNISKKKKSWTYQPLPLPNDLLDQKNSI